jgi:hypothetical protein
MGEALACEPSVVELQGKMLFGVDSLLYVYEQHGSLLQVYRSPLVRDSDELYAPVRALVGLRCPDYIETVQDISMSFGMAECLIYKLGGGQPLPN